MLRSNYTRGQINSLWTELAGLPALIQGLKDEIAKSQKEQIELEKTLRELITTKLTPGKRLNIAIQSQINVLTLPAQRDKLTAQIKPHQDKLDELRPLRDKEDAALKPIDERIIKLKDAIALFEAREKLQSVEMAKAENLGKLRSFQDNLDVLCPLREAASKNERSANESLQHLRRELDNVRAERAKIERERRERERQERERIEREQREREQAQAASGGFEASTQPVGGFEASTQPVGGYEANAQAPGGYGSSVQQPVSTYSVSTQVAEVADDSILLSKIADLESEVRRFHQEKSRIDADIESNEAGFRVAESNNTQFERHLRQINDEIFGLRNRLTGFAYVDDFPQLQKLLRAEYTRREPHARRQQELNDSIDDHAARKAALERERKRLIDKLEESKPLTAEFTGNEDLADLNKKLTAGLQARKELKVERDKLRREIKTRKNKIDADESELAQKNKREQTLEANEFLIKFRDTPAQLVTRILESLNLEIPAFDYAHPTGLSEQVRINLISLQTKANVIMRPPATVAGYSIEDYRRQYTQLCGLLWETRANTPKHEISFTAMLDRVLGDDPIEAADAKASYRLLKDANKEALRDNTPADLAAYEVQQYEAAMQRFAAALLEKPIPDTRAMRSFFVKGTALMTNIRDERELARNSHGVIPFNLRLHTQILVTATAMLSNPEDEALHTRLALLAKGDITGKPSVVKRVFGAIMMFLGAAAALVGGLFLAGVMPVISPETAIPNIVTGASMLAGGFGLFAGGVALVVNGRTKGTTKCVENFDKAGFSAANGVVTGRVVDHPAAEGHLATSVSQYDDIPTPTAPKLNA